MAKIEKVVIGALAGVVVFGLTRNKSESPATPMLPASSRARPVRAPAPVLREAQVRMMVLEWGMTPDRFHGRARAWAEAASAERAPALPPAAEPTPDDLGGDAPCVELDGLDALLECYFASEARPGNFYSVQPGDTPETIAREALASVGEPTKQALLDYIWCFSGGRYNLHRYGTRSTTRSRTGQSFSAQWVVPGIGKGLRGAFLPRNADAVELMARGLSVPRTIDEEAVRVVDDATSLGTIWLPPVCADQLDEGIVTCAPYSYEDGSSALEPPPRLLYRLREAV